MRPAVGEAIRSISSQSFQPTSPTQISDVPGRVVIRNGLRSPLAMIRRAAGSVLEASGLVGRPAPVSGSIRMIEPFIPVGSLLVPPAVRPTWLWFAIVAGLRIL